MRRYYRFVIVAASLASVGVLQVREATDQGLGDPRVAALYVAVGASLALLVLSAMLSERLTRLCRQAIKLNPWAAILAGIFIGVGLGQWIGGGQIADAANGVAYGFSVLAGFYVVPCVLYQSDTVFFYFRTIAVLGAAIALVGLYSSVTGSAEFLGLAAGTKPGSLFGTGLKVTASLFGKGNHYAFSMAISMWLALAAVPGAVAPFRRSRFKESLLRWMIAGLFLAAIAVSWSRSMYVAMAGATVVYALSRPEVKARAFVLLPLGLVVLGGGFWYLSGQEWFSIAVRLALQPEEGLTGRSQLWVAALEIIRQNPVTGVGLGGSASKEAIYQFGGYQWEAFAMGAHNAFLDLGVRGGVPLAVSYIAVIVSTWKCILKSNLRKVPEYVSRTGRILLAALFVISVSVMFTSMNLGGLNFASLNLSILLGLASAFPLVQVPPLNRTAHTTPRS